MRQITKALALTVITSAVLTSCGNETPWSGPADQGGLTLNFQSDGRVMRQTRADDSMSPIVPDANQFGVSLVKSDQSFSKRWTSVEAFNRETSFPIGEYTITASYGNMEVEGFENPYYEGANDVHVSPGVNSEVNVTATLANSMVSIRYTDEFKNIYNSYSAAVQTEGHEWVVFARDEDRPAYVSPSEEVKLSLTLTNQAGDRVTIQPASFTAVARHHYVVTIGVEGNTTSGTLSLNVVFDDDVVAETVNVSLGDELFTAPAPTVNANGFSADDTLETFEYSEVNKNPEFHVFAFGGLKSTTINIISENGYSPVFGRSVELVNADALTQQQLETEGLDCAGFFRNVDKMGVVNVKGLLERLPAGKYTVEVQAMDAMTRISEPLRLNAEVSVLEVNLEIAEQCRFLSPEVKVDLVTNCAEVRDMVSFRVPDSGNKMTDATVKSVELVSSSQAARSNSEYRYRYTLAIEPSSRSNIDIELQMKSNTNKKVSLSIPVAAPEYSVTTDAFATYALFKIEASDNAYVKSIIDNCQVYNGEDAVPSSNVYHDVTNSVIRVSGLTPGVKYVGLKLKISTFEKEIGEFDTEVAANVPNANFQNSSETIRIAGIATGGTYKCSTIYTKTYQNKTTISAQEADGWSSINAKTCYTGSSNQNTWFMVPSTYVSNGTCVIRSVAYDHNGTLPAIDNRGVALTGKYYSTKAPTISSRAAGELFLGSYSYTSSGESRSEGLEFNSRPSAVSFDYMYSPYGNETASAEVSVVLDNGAEISGSTTLASAGSYITKQIALPAYPFGQKAKMIKIKFKSTSGSEIGVNIPTGDNLKDIKDSETSTNVTIAENAYKALATGSVLTIDNVKLEYVSPSAKTSVKSRR